MYKTNPEDCATGCTGTNCGLYKAKKNVPCMLYQHEQTCLKGGYDEQDRLLSVSPLGACEWVGGMCQDLTSCEDGFWPNTEAKVCAPCAELSSWYAYTYITPRDCMFWFVSLYFLVFSSRTCAALFPVSCCVTHTNGRTS